MRDDHNLTNAATGSVCTKTAIYESGCSCRSRTFRGRGEVFPCCLGCQGKVEWELVQELPVLDPASTSSPSKYRGRDGLRGRAGTTTAPDVPTQRAAPA